MSLIRKQNNPLLVFDNIKNLKTLLKPIPVKSQEKLLLALNERALKLYKTICNGFEDYPEANFKINCEIRTNSCFSIFVTFGYGLNYGLYIYDDKNCIINFNDDDKAKVLSDYIFPHKIEMKEIIFNAQIGSFTSKFNFNNESLK